ncbi:hypothetical protein QWZ13_17870 [Reinekea marina]|nr:hypothetical protein [Reinekea marina]MDN3650778.1 hypothetical protein [Reinekea marina]
MNVFKNYPSHCNTAIRYNKIDSIKNQHRLKFSLLLSIPLLR